MGFSRFVLAGLSVALPHVVDEKRHLVEANTLAVTAGAGFSALGAVSAIGLRMLVGAGDAGLGAHHVRSPRVGPLAAAVVAAGFRRRSLGPDARNGPARTIVAVLRGFVDGAHAVAANPSIAASFAGLAAHRLAFGISTLLTLLLYRYTFTDIGPLRAGLPGIGEASGRGRGRAAVRRARHAAARAPLRAAVDDPGGADRRLRHAARCWGCSSACPLVLVAAFVIGLAGQVVKLCADAAVQGEGPDGALGRIFALYDVVFNVGYVAAVALAAFAAPPNGWAPWLFASASGLYLLGLLPQRPAAPRPPVTARSG